MNTFLTFYGITSLIYDFYEMVVYIYNRSPYGSILNEYSYLSNVSVKSGSVSVENDRLSDPDYIEPTKLKMKLRKRK